MVNSDLVIVRGGGDISTGTIQKLHRSGFNVLVLEIEKPTTIRRTVAFSEAVFKGEIEIEGIKGRLDTAKEFCIKNGFGRNLRERLNTVGVKSFSCNETCFDDELIELLLKFKWWDKSVEEINSLIPILTCSELEKVRNEIEARL